MAVAWTNKKTRGFFLDDAAFLRETGLSRNTQKDVMYSIALACPAEYNLMRRELVHGVTHTLAQQLYRTVYAALLEGKKEKDGTGLVKIPDDVADKLGVTRGHVSPQIKESEVSQIAYEVATSLIKLLDEKVCEHIMPSTLSQLANTKIAAKTTARIAAGLLSPQKRF